MIFCSLNIPTYDHENATEKLDLRVSWRFILGSFTEDAFPVSRSLRVDPSFEDTSAFKQFVGSFGEQILSSSDFIQLNS